jgi:Copper type II ascorbate-dependent monooxygenase, C-terminal domain
MLKWVHLAAPATVLGLGALAIALTTAAPVRGGSPAPARQSTFTQDIAPILYQNCTTCHREGEVAPFPLVTYEDASRRAATIAAVTQSRTMPPWKAESHGEFVGERRLTDEQIALIQQWARDGAPEGPPEALPALPQYPSGGWHLGTPDRVLQPKAAYTVAAEGDDVYRCFVIPTGLDEERFLSAVDVRPGNRRVVHHVILYLDTSGTARRKEQESSDGAPGYTSFGGPGFPASGTLGGWVPGSEVQRLPEGVGWRLPKGADIVLQVHYSRSGKTETDLTQIGLYFARGPVDKQMRVMAVLALPLLIPPGDAHYETRAASAPLPAGITVREVWPHMHLLGRDMTLTAALPDGTTQPLVKVADWDFNWQTRYVLKEPKALPRGSTVRLLAHYDNSAENPRNPNTPPKLTTWGEQTTDEMCIGFLLYTADDEHLTRGIVGQDVPLFAGGDTGKWVPEILAAFDKNGDRALDEAELNGMLAFFRARFFAMGRGAPAGNSSRGGSTHGAGDADSDPLQRAARGVLMLFDQSRDGKLDATELETLVQLLTRRLTRAAANAGLR